MPAVFKKMGGGMRQLTVSFIAILVAHIGLVYAEIYSRDDFNYRSYKPKTSVGFYTGKTCRSINIDHVVSLKDAFESGASSWSEAQKTAFANDRENHVPSCRRVNSSKGSAGPKDFLRRSEDGKGLDYKILDFCGYVLKYHSVKIKYGLSLASNSSNIFNRCGIGDKQ